MRASLVAVLLVLAACSPGVDEPRRAREHPVPLVACEDAEHFADQDGAVLLAVLEDYMASEDVYGMRARGGALLVGESTLGSAGLSVEPTEWMSDDEFYLLHRVGGLAPVLRERNRDGRSVALPANRSPELVVAPRAVMREAGGGTGYATHVEGVEVPEHWAKATLTLPAYSEDGEHAYVVGVLGRGSCFRADSQYLLAQQGGAWVIEEKIER